MDGGGGETCGTYDHPNMRGIGPSTPSQTAWALLGLLAAGEELSESVKEGICWLIDQQAHDGSWSERFYTGTGFPRTFYMAYHLSRQYFPLMALAEFAKASQKKHS